MYYNKVVDSLVGNWFKRRPMRKFIALTVVFFVSIGFAQIASAGPERLESKEIAPAPPPCTWTGFYIGLNAGVTEFDFRSTDINYYQYGASVGYDSVAFTGGGQIGFNYQWNDLVLGIEADASGLTARTRSFNNEGNDTDGIYDYGKIDFMGTIRPRLGISFNDNRALIYVTGGLAYAKGKWEATYYNDISTGAVGGEWRGDDWRWGWTGGFGLEYALNCHWSLRAEGLYTWLDQNTVHLSGGEDYPTYSYYRWRFNDSLWSYRVGIDYKFGGFFGHH